MVSTRHPAINPQRIVNGSLAGCVLAVARWLVIAGRPSTVHEAADAARPLTYLMPRYPR
jgi:hypothetical protein